MTRKQRNRKYKVFHNVLLKSISEDLTSRRSSYASLHRCSSAGPVKHHKKKTQHKRRQVRLLLTMGEAGRFGMHRKKGHAIAAADECG